MARITVEDCLKKVENRFGLIHLAAKRVRQLRKGEEPLVVCKNTDIVTALREIAAGEIYQLRIEDQPNEETQGTAEFETAEQTVEEIAETTQEESPKEES